ncbi:MAG: ATP-binding cassette domain-containing protein [Chitinophagaceae bacterium]|nr:ATP-binding cassette domain-containing protein [Chitinophagaceae bacterium]
MPIITVDNIHKNYGPIQALKGVSFKVPEGSVFGILGPNGSGKTTLLGILLDVLKATSGSYQLFDEAPAKKHRQQIGTLLETPNFYHYLSAVQNLRINARIKGRDEKDIDRVLDIVDLTNRKHSKFSTYSLGMKQRLAVASCLLGNPSVLMFDEPTNGLDPVGIAETRELIKRLNKEGKTIIMASHLLDEVEKVCSHVAVLMKGTLITHGHVDEILVNEDIVELGTDNIDQLLSILQNFPASISVRKNDNHIEAIFASGEAQLGRINQYCFEKGVVLSHLRVRRKSLEAKFFELTKAN